MRINISRETADYVYRLFRSAFPACSRMPTPLYVDRTKDRLLVLVSNATSNATRISTPRKGTGGACAIRPCESCPCPCNIPIDNNPPSFYALDSLQGRIPTLNHLDSQHREHSPALSAHPDTSKPHSETELRKMFHTADIHLKPLAVPIDLCMHDFIR